MQRLFHAEDRNLLIAMAALSLGGLLAAVLLNLALAAYTNQAIQETYAGIVGTVVQRYPEAEAQVVQTLRAAIDGASNAFEASADARLLDANFQRAYSLMSSKSARDSFNLREEPEEVRNRYGRTRFGQCCLMARRMIERGVRFVTINMFETVFNEITWDIHGSAPFSPIECYKDEVGPNFDNAFSALLEDLHRRGLLDNTMVLAFGEFGRTPKVNPAGGRDHHPGCWTALFAGGPIQGGRVVGASDEIGSAPLDRPVTTGEIAATAFHGLGISLDTELTGPGSRPIRIVDHGVEPIHELF